MYMKKTRLIVTNAVYQVLDKDGCRVEVGPDHEGLGLVELRVVNSKGDIVQALGLTPVQAKLVGKALRKSAKGAAVVLPKPPPQEEVTTAKPSPRRVIAKPRGG
jgi:hypothetical protein